MVTSGQIVDFLGKLEALGVRTGTTVEIKTVALEDLKVPKAPAPDAEASADAKASDTPAPAAPAKKVLTASLVVIGEFEDLYQFLILLENVPYDMQIDKMALNKPEGAQYGKVQLSPKDWKGEFTITLLSFVSQ